MLTLSSNHVTGHIAGKMISATVVAGSGAPTGLFTLQPPQNDPVFGTFVIALRQAGGPAAGARSLALAMCYIKDRIPDPQAAAAHIFKQNVSAYYCFKAAVPGGTQRAAAGGAGTEAFVLSQHVIPGAYGVVVASGFADLVAALQAAGGGLLTVT